MPGKIFVSYRRDDVAGDARGIHDGLAAKFGASSVFMDVDNLFAGQRFDKELEQALATCDVLIAVIGPRWMELLAAKIKSGERDYVREEIAAALQREIVVIPVRVGQEGSMAPLPRGEDLPADIRDLVLHQRQDVAHERFRRDIADLVAAIEMVRSRKRRPLPWRRAAWAALVLVPLAAAVVFAYSARRPVGWLSAGRSQCETVGNSGGGADRCIVPGSGEAFKDCPECPDMVVVPKGTFNMGSRENEWESPLHQVTIARPFAVGRFAVTRAEFDAFVRAGGHDPGAKCWILRRREGNVENLELAGYSYRDPGFAQEDDHPVVCTNWSDTKAYVNWLNQKIGKKGAYRLLSESEREYVTRAGTETPFWWGYSISAEQANYNAEQPYANGPTGKWRLQTVPVGSFDPNPWGLYQVHGNVSEWVEDCFHYTYDGAPSDGSAWRPGSCSRRVLRGGSWGSAPWDLRAAGGRGNLLGFRVAKTLSP
jgi:formylglycine-generating enzyme required for sulfatase activity